MKRRIFLDTEWTAPPWSERSELMWIGLADEEGRLSAVVGAPDSCKTTVGCHTASAYSTSSNRSPAVSGHASDTVAPTFHPNQIARALLTSSTGARRSHDAAGHSANLLPQLHDVVPVANGGRHTAPPTRKCNDQRAAQPVATANGRLTRPICSSTLDPVRLKWLSAGVDPCDRARAAGARARPSEVLLTRSRCARSRARPR